MQTQCPAVTFDAVWYSGVGVPRIVVYLLHVPISARYPSEWGAWMNPFTTTHACSDRRVDVGSSYIEGEGARVLTLSEGILGNFPDWYNKGITEY